MITLIMHELVGSPQDGYICISLEDESDAETATILASDRAVVIALVKCILVEWFLMLSIEFLQENHPNAFK